MPFAKLFDTPHGQLLATHEYDEDYADGPFRITLRGEQVRGVDPSLTFGWESEAERDAAFVSIDQQKADRTAAELLAAIRGLMGGHGNA